MGCIRYCIYTELHPDLHSCSNIQKTNIQLDGVISTDDYMTATDNYQQRCVKSLKTWQANTEGYHRNTSGLRLATVFLMHRCIPHIYSHINGCR